MSASKEAGGNNGLAVRAWAGVEGSAQPQTETVRVGEGLRASGVVGWCMEPRRPSVPGLGERESERAAHIRAKKECELQALQALQVLQDLVLHVPLR